MKKIANQIISCLLLLIIVTSNAGFAIIEHSCKRVESAVCSEPTEMSCCSSELNVFKTNHKESVNAGCCDIEMQFIKFEFDGIYDAFQINIKPVELKIEYSFYNNIQNTNEFAFYFSKSPIPYSGRSILQANHNLTI